MFNKFYMLGMISLLVSIFFSGCASKEITPGERSSSSFSLPYGYEDEVSKQVVKKFIKQKSKGLRLQFSNPNVGYPKEECSRNIFSDDITCSYHGEAYLVYDVPYLKKYGQKRQQVIYSYEISKSGNVYVY